MAKQKPHVPEGAKKKTTEKGPHGGGNKYYDGAKLVNTKFTTHSPFGKKS